MLTYLCTLGPIHVLSLEMLTKKTLMLMAILSGQRGQTLHALTTSRMTKTDSMITFYIDKPLKTSRPGHHHGVVRFTAFPTDSNLCVVAHIYDYLECTDRFRGAHVSKLFITYGSPNQEASRASISRWIKAVVSIKMQVLTYLFILPILLGQPLPVRLLSRM